MKTSLLKATGTERNANIFNHSRQVFTFKNLSAFLFKEVTYEINRRKNEGIAFSKT